MRANVTLLNTVAGASSSVRFDIRMGVSLPVDGKIEIEFPVENYRFLSSNMATLSELQLDGLIDNSNTIEYWVLADEVSMTAEADSGSIVIKRNGNGDETAMLSQTEILLSGLVNPGVSGWVSLVGGGSVATHWTEFGVVTQTKSGRIIEENCDALLAMVTPGTVHRTSMILDSSLTGEGLTADTHFTIQNSIPADGVIEITFAHDILDIGLQSVGGIDGGFYTTHTNRTVTLIRDGGGTSAIRSIMNLTVSYDDGPRATNAFAGSCSSTPTTLAVATAACEADDSCVALHQYGGFALGCDPSQRWRYCSSITKYKTTGPACTKYKPDLSTGYIGTTYNASDSSRLSEITFTFDKLVYPSYVQGSHVITTMDRDRRIIDQSAPFPPTRMLKGVSVTLGSLSIGTFFTTATVTFTLSSPLDPDGKISVRFPTRFADLTMAVLKNFTMAPSINTNFAVGGSGWATVHDDYTVRIHRGSGYTGGTAGQPSGVVTDGTTIPSEVQIVLVLDMIVTPPVSGYGLPYRVTTHRNQYEAALSDYSPVDSAYPVDGEVILSGALAGASDVNTGFTSTAIKQTVGLCFDQQITWDNSATVDYIQAIATSAGISKYSVEVSRIRGREVPVSECASRRRLYGGTDSTALLLSGAGSSLTDRFGGGGDGSRRRLTGGPSCVSGTLSTDQSTCCLASCGVCQQTNDCVSLTGGDTGCCPAIIKTLGRWCSDYDAPCIQTGGDGTYVGNDFSIDHVIVIDTVRTDSTQVTAAIANSTNLVKSVTSTPSFSSLSVTSTASTAEEIQAPKIVLSPPYDVGQMTSFTVTFTLSRALPSDGRIRFYLNHYWLVVRFATLQSISWDMDDTGVGLGVWTLNTNSTTDHGNYTNYCDVVRGGGGASIGVGQTLTFVIGNIVQTGRGPAWFGNYALKTLDASFDTIDVADPIKLTVPNDTTDVLFNFCVNRTNLTAVYAVPPIAVPPIVTYSDATDWGLIVLAFILGLLICCCGMFTYQNRNEKAEKIAKNDGKVVPVTDEVDFKVEVAVPAEVPNDDGSSAVLTSIEVEGSSTEIINPTKLTTLEASTNTVQVAESVVVLPESPGNVVAKAEASVVNVTWSAPSNVVSGEAEVAIYIVTSEPAGCNICVESKVDCSCGVTGLALGVEYSFSVVCVGVGGRGRVSEPSQTVVLVGPPGPPQQVVAEFVETEDAEEAAVVRWSGPDSNGGSKITAYTVVSYPDGIAVESVVGVEGVEEGSFEVQVPGLSMDTAYTFTVYATSEAGKGEVSDPCRPIVRMKATEASSIVDVSLEKNTTTIVKNQVNDSTIQISKQVIGSSADVYADTDFSEFSVEDTTGADMSVAVQVQEKGMVMTAGANGFEEPVPVVLPDSPHHVAATTRASVVNVSWLEPANVTSGEIEVVAYVVTSEPEGCKMCIQAEFASVDCSCEAKGLDLGVAYRFSVVCVGIGGWGPASKPSNPVVPVGPPGPPLQLTASFEDEVCAEETQRAAVKWYPPTTNGGCKIKTYTIVSYPDGIEVESSVDEGPGGSIEGAKGRMGNVTGGGRSPGSRKGAGGSGAGGGEEEKEFLWVWVPGLRAKTAYTFVAYAKNRLGPGEISYPCPPIMYCPPTVTMDKGTMVQSDTKDLKRREVLRKIQDIAKKVLDGQCPDVEVDLVEHRIYLKVGTFHHSCTLLMYFPYPHPSIFAKYVTLCTYHPPVSNIHVQYDIHVHYAGDRQFLGRDGGSQTRELPNRHPATSGCSSHLQRLYHAWDGPGAPAGGGARASHGQHQEVLVALRRAGEADCKECANCWGTGCHAPSEGLRTVEVLSSSVYCHALCPAFDV
jgi:hypothetical protein